MLRFYSTNKYPVNKARNKHLKYKPWAFLLQTYDQWRKNMGESLGLETWYLVYPFIISCCPSFPLIYP